jgi:hypothetical protein
LVDPISHAVAKIPPDTLANEIVGATLLIARFEDLNRIVSRAWRIVIRPAGADCSFGTAKGAT